MHGHQYRRNGSHFVIQCGRWRRRERSFILCGIGESAQPASPPPAAVTWIGHATVLIECDGLRVLTDPVLGRWIGPVARLSAPVDPAALGRVDCVLLSHLHFDHADLPSLRTLGLSTPLLCPYPAARWFRGAGFSEVRELRAGEDVEVGPLRVIATPAVHDPRRRPRGPAAAPVGYVLRGSRSAYFAGDTDLFAQMADLRGAIDVALLPISGWGSGLGPGHLDPRRAAQAAALIEPAIAIPIHWGTFALGPPLRRPSDVTLPARQFAAFAAEFAPGVEVRVLALGERLEL